MSAGEVKGMTARDPDESFAIGPRHIATPQAQVFKKGEGTDGVEKPWVWKEDGTHAERLEGG